MDHIQLPIDRSREPWRFIDLDLWQPLNLFLAVDPDHKDPTSTAPFCVAGSGGANAIASAIFPRNNTKKQLRK